jgi:hypothetical protein
MKHTILAGLALTIAATALPAPSAEAQVSSGRNPWCLRDGPMGRGTWDCTYHTFEQCNFSSVYGVDGSCVQNPNYRGPRQNRNSRRGQEGTWGWGSWR